MMQPTRDTKI